MKASIQEDYISLLSIVKNLWSKRKKLFRIVFFFTFIGIFSAIFTPTQYTSHVKFLSQTSTDARSSGKWSGIAALVGVNLNSGTTNDEIPTNIYPKIIKSLNYQRNLMDVRLYFKKLDTTITLSEYFFNHKKDGVLETTKKYTIGLPKTIVEKIKNKDSRIINTYSLDSLNFMTLDEQRLRGFISGVLKYTMDEADGVISVSATMPESISAAQLAKEAYNLLQKEVISYRTAKAQDQMNFIEKQYQEQKENFNNAQKKFALYKDRNKFNITQTSQIEFQRLQSNHDLTYTVFSELERQRVAQKIQVKKDTPIFTTLNDALVPLDSSNSNGFRTILIYTFLGFIFAVLYGLWIEFYQKFKIAWKKI